MNTLRTQGSNQNVLSTNTELKPNHDWSFTNRCLLHLRLFRKRLLMSLKTWRTIGIKPGISFSSLTCKPWSSRGSQMKGSRLNYYKSNETTRARTHKRRSKKYSAESLILRFHLRKRIFDKNWNLSSQEWNKQHWILLLSAPGLVKARTSSTDRLFILKGSPKGNFLWSY